MYKTKHRANLSKKRTAESVDFYKKKNKKMQMSSENIEKRSNKTDDIGRDRKSIHFTKYKTTKKANHVERRDMPILKKTVSNDSQMPLNKYLAHSGVCSRREAAAHIKNGMVEVNGDIQKNPAYKVVKSDIVKYKSKTVSLVDQGLYILLNKPKDYICTVEDPNARKKVLDLIPEHEQDRIYPVGRLDRNTTGVLLLTNDGDLTQKLTHPGYEVKKIYHIKLNKPLTQKDFNTLLKGINLEDGFIAPDIMFYQGMDKSELGIQIHSGRNRIIRRMFEHLGYDVKSLDRVMFADLTKKNIPRGKWRYLDKQEIVRLKVFYKNFAKKDSKKTSMAKNRSNDQ